MFITRKDKDRKGKPDNNTEEMKISVIIPTFKPQGYLWECLDSLLAQTLPMDKFEVLVVLNGSKEPYYEQIADYAIRHAGCLNIKILYTSEGGVSNARNIGLDNAKGRFIAFIDDDDRVSPTYLEEMLSKADDNTIIISNTYNYCESEPDVLLSGRTTELHGVLSAKGKTSLKSSRRFFFTVWMKLIPAAIIAGRRFDPKFAVGEDGIFMFRISDKIKFTDFTSGNAIYYHRLRIDSAMANQTDNGWLKRMWNDIKMICAYTQIYINGLRRYSLHFFLTRIRGSIHI